MPNYKTLLIILFLSGFLIYCDNGTESNNQSRLIEFKIPVKVEVKGYSDHIMEPFLSRDGQTLFFNNSNDPAVNTNIHWAQKINDSTFQYLGEVQNINTNDLDGVPSMDNSNKLLFVSTRNYTPLQSTIYQCDFVNGSASNIRLISGASKNQPGWINYDVEVSADGKFLYFADGRFDTPGGPHEGDLIIAEKNYDTYQRLSDQSVLKNINTSSLEYAAGISSDALELYFTRLDVPITANSSPKIYVTTRASTNENFRMPYRIPEIDGFAEAPTISPDSKIIYFHKRENDMHVLYMIRKAD